MSRGCGFSLLCLSQQLQSESSDTGNSYSLAVQQRYGWVLAEGQVLLLRYRLWMRGEGLSLHTQHKHILSPCLWDELLLYVPRRTPGLFPRVLPLPSQACRSSGCRPARELWCQPGAPELLWFILRQSLNCSAVVKCVRVLCSECRV